MGIERFEYNFIVYLGNTSEDVTNIDYVLYECGCNDAIVCTLDGYVYLEFTRQGTGYYPVFNETVKQITNHSVGLKVVNGHLKDIKIIKN